MSSDLGHGPAHSIVTNTSHLVMAFLGGQNYANQIKRFKDKPVELGHVFLHTIEHGLVDFPHVLATSDAA